MILPKRVLGFDPGTRVLGFAVIERVVGSKGVGFKQWIVRDIGVMRLNPKASLMQRLAGIHDEVGALIIEHKPALVAVEKAFFGENAASTLRIGEARGSILSAVGRTKSELFEITPAEVKKLIGGNGRASKDQVADGITALLGFKHRNLPSDATDALGIALSAAMRHLWVP
jgi:crossover junction endodeoxyribonuclease RuvC